MSERLSTEVLQDVNEQFEIIVAGYAITYEERSATGATVRVPPEAPRGDWLTEAAGLTPPGADPEEDNGVIIDVDGSLDSEETHEAIKDFLLGEPLAEPSKQSGYAELGFDQSTGEDAYLIFREVRSNYVNLWNRRRQRMEKDREAELLPRHVAITHDRDGVIHLLISYFGPVDLRSIKKFRERITEADPGSTDWARVVAGLGHTGLHGGDELSEAIAELADPDLGLMDKDDASFDAVVHALGEHGRGSPLIQAEAAEKSLEVLSEPATSGRRRRNQRKEKRLGVAQVYTIRPDQQAA